MQASWAVGLAAAVSLASGPVRADNLPLDVPAKHWAAPAVSAVVRTGVMTAPSNAFRGDRKVTRNELIGVLVRLEKALSGRQWQGPPAAAVRERPRQPSWKSKHVSRFDLAVVVARVAPIAVAGLPAKPAAKPYDSQALPKAPSLKGVTAGTAVRRELQYLAGRRLVWPGSVLLKPGPQPVTGEQLASVMAQFVIGLNGTATDEPALQLELNQRPPSGAPPGARIEGVTSPRP